jgi:hypothetical protein
VGVMGYGFFCGGDPRRFYPDPEASTEAERAQHQADCEACDRGERPDVNGKAPHFRTDNDGAVMHVVPAGYGLGSYDDDDGDFDDDDLPDLPHDPYDGCNCETCYEAGVLKRFRGEVH